MAEVNLQCKLNVVASIYEYDENEHLGKGAFGQVFTGSSVIDGKRVAIKKIKRENRKDQELQIMKKKINHQNIVKYLADDLTELHCYIVMEKCDGNLLELLQAFGGKFSKEIDLQSAVSQIVTGYEVLHMAKIIHRDLKPQNILYIVNEKSGWVILKLADFGCSKMLLGGLYAETTIGTFGYIAPEVINVYTGKGHYDARADLYSMGLIFCQIATGISPPFKPFPPDNLPKDINSLVIKLSQHNYKERIEPRQLFLHPYVQCGKEIPLQLLSDHECATNAIISKNEDLHRGQSKFRRLISSLFQKSASKQEISRKPEQVINIDSTKIDEEKKCNINSASTLNWKGSKQSLNSDSGFSSLEGVSDHAFCSFTEATDAAIQINLLGFPEGMYMGLGTSHLGLYDNLSDSIQYKSSIANIDVKKTPHYFRKSKIAQSFETTEENLMLRQVDERKYSSSDNCIAYAALTEERTSYIFITDQRIMVVSKKDVFSGMKVSWTHDWSELNGPPTLDSVSGGNTLLISMKDISKSNKFICFHNQRYAKMIAERGKIAYCSVN